MSIAPNVTVIPAKAQTEINRSKYQQLRVAAYCRVSTEQEEQQSSYQVQIAYYTNLINRKKEWTLAGIFADEGISGTQTKNRTGFKRMIRMCKNKKIDLVITKSISRFARNTVDCLEYVRQLKDLGIGVIFEKENINTLTMTSEFMIALYGSFAQAESESISKNVSWGKEKAYREGRVQFQYKHLLGYKRGDNGEPEIVPEEAETVRLIFKLFLDGYSMKEIRPHSLQYHSYLKSYCLDLNRESCDCDVQEQLRFQAGRQCFSEQITILGRNTECNRITMEFIYHLTEI